MIEVEKKVLLTEDAIASIRKKAIFLKESTFSDTYFDTEDYRFTLQNIWLRQRDQKPELKVGITKSNEGINRFEEIIDEEKISQFLKLPSAKTFSERLSFAKIFPFCTFKTNRQKYQLGEFAIDLDIADFGDFTYRVGEIELLVEHQAELLIAEKKISDFLDSLGIDSIPSIPAKLTVYLAEKRKPHYLSLVKAGVIS